MDSFFYPVYKNNLLVKSLNVRSESLCKFNLLEATIGNGLFLQFLSKPTLTYIVRQFTITSIIY